METSPFDHGFSNPLTDKSMAEILGYVRALKDVHNYTEEQQLMGLKDKIAATIDEIQFIIEREGTILDDMATKILSGTKF